MFGNYAAQAGVIAGTAGSSPNIIQPSITWNFSGVIVLDFDPPGIENFNDRPRINIWRDVNGQPDFNYLRFVSGGKDLLSPSPTGNLIIEPWGNRNTGTITFPSTSIGNNVLAGVDLFTHNFAPPVNLIPPISEWTIDNTSVTGEIKYQYRFKTGQKYPNVVIELDYLSNCKPVNIPSCNPSLNVLIFVGTGSNGCPIFSCRSRDSLTSFIERGSLYNPQTSWQSGLGNAQFGVWNIVTGSGSFRNIQFASNVSPAGRTSVGTSAFFLVGNSGSISTGHRIDLNLVNFMNTGSRLALDVSYAWNAGTREIIFRGINNTFAQYRFFHGNVNDELRYFRSGVTNGSPGILTNGLQLTGMAFNRAFNYELIHLGTGMQLNVRSPNTSLNQNLIYTDIITGNINFNTLITGISFVVSNLPNILQVDYFNYGIFFNNIVYDNLPPSPTELFARNVSTTSFLLNWRDVFSATGYRLDIATDNNFNNYLPGYSNRFITGTTHNITSLTKSTNYFARVRSVNTYGTGAFSPVLNVKTFENILNLNFADFGAAPCAKATILNYLNNSNFQQQIYVRGSLDDDLIVNGVIYESGLYPYPWGGLMTCPYSPPINGAHTITPFITTLSPNQTLLLENISYHGNLGYSFNVYIASGNINTQFI